MQAVQRIVVTGDIMRQRVIGGSPQSENIQWLYHLVEPALGCISDLPVSYLLFTGDAACLGTRLFRANRTQPSFAAWTVLHAKPPDARDLALIWDAFEGALVIGFEMTEMVRLGLEALQIPYIDVTIHPVRFLDDLLLGVRTNLAGLVGALQAYRVTEADIRVGAGLARATLVKEGRIRHVQGHDLALFAGQTNDDKVLIVNGRFVRADDFLGRFEVLCREHPQVLVKPHPFARENAMVTALTRLFANTRLVHDNFYHLLMQDAVTHCYSLTSSTSVEANHLGKRGVHLGTYPLRFSHDCATGGTYLSVYPEIYLPAFWQPVLALVVSDLRDPPAIRLTPQRSRLRYTLRSYWGADLFENIP